LAIMKDPRCGPAGVIALVLVLLMKFAALASLPVGSWCAFLLAPVLGRAALTAFFVTTPYVRSGGIGASLVGASRLGCLIALSLTGVFCLLLGWRGWVSFAASVVVFFVWRRACVRRLGGFTGDTAGAVTEMIEATVLVVWVLCR
jgi:adenosylcobinamide-GDP ribazoletransferase